MTKKKLFTMEDVNRIKRTTSKATGGIIPKGSLASKAESSVAKRKKE